MAFSIAGPGCDLVVATLRFMGSAGASLGTRVARETFLPGLDQTPMLYPPHNVLPTHLGSELGSPSWLTKG